MPDLADPRLTEWRNEGGGNKLVWRRYWTIGKRYRAAVICESWRVLDGNHEPFAWVAFPVQGGELHTRETEGTAVSVDEAKRRADEGLAFLLRDMPAIPATPATAGGSDA